MHRSIALQGPANALQVWVSGTGKTFGGHVNIFGTFHLRQAKIVVDR